MLLKIMVIKRPKRKLPLKLWFPERKSWYSKAVKREILVLWKDNRVHRYTFNAPNQGCTLWSEHLNERECDIRRVIIRDTFWEVDLRSSIEKRLNTYEIVYK